MKTGYIEYGFYDNLRVLNPTAHNTDWPVCFYFTIPFRVCQNLSVTKGQEGNFYKGWSKKRVYRVRCKLERDCNIYRKQSQRPIFFD